MPKLPLLLLILAGGLRAQSADSPRGHWTGDIEAPNGNTVGFAFDIDKGAKGGWVGSMAVPMQGVTGIPLGGISFEGGQLKFSVSAGSAAPSYSGKISADGKTIAGEFTQGGQSVALKLSHAGEPKVELPKASPPVAPEFLGEWEGTLEGPGLRLIMKLSNEGGNAKAILVSLDQGGVEIPGSSVTQKEAKLNVDVRAVNGGYAAEINKEGTELKGEWTQMGKSMPLNLKKKAAAPAK